jgi:hypothetical protein
MYARFQRPSLSPSSSVTISISSIHCSSGKNLTHPFPEFALTDWQRPFTFERASTGISAETSERVGKAQTLHVETGRRHCAATMSYSVLPLSEMKRPSSESGCPFLCVNN